MIRAALIFATVFLALLAPAASGIARESVAADRTQPATSSTDPFNRATTFRIGSGFRSDAAYVDASLADPQSFPDLSYGVPLTEAEAAEIDRRLAVQLAVDPAIEWAATQSNFGGAWMDQSDQGTAVFQIVGDSTSFAAALAKRVPAGVRVRIESVANTRKSLEATKERLWIDRAALLSQGIDLQSVGLDIRNNTVIAEIGGTPGTEIARAESTDLSAYGAVATTPNVPGENDACSNRSNCVPMKGGLKIVATKDSAMWCTSGFNVRLTGTSTMRVLTAGHCLTKAPMAIGDGWKVNGGQFGTAKTSTWAVGANADAGLIAQGAITGADNLLYGINSTDIRTVGGWVATASQNYGDYLCRSGAASGFWCGNISIEDRTKDVDGKAIDHQWVVDFDAIPGDSGAPYFTTSSGVTLAWGTHSDSTDSAPPGGSAWYSPFPWIQTVLSNSGNQISLCTDQYCGL